LCHREDDAQLARFEPVSFEHTGKPGRPRIIISRAWLEAAVSPMNGLSLVAIARMCGTCSKTVRKSLKEYGIAFGYSPITKEELDVLIDSFKQHKPESGYRYAMGYLQRHQLRIRRKDVLDALRERDGLGQQLRTHEANERGEYIVPRSNYLWCLDGHHKLIRWGIVIYGIIDAFCHTVSTLFPCFEARWLCDSRGLAQIVAMRASNNNTAETVSILFREAVGRYGLPSRVRGDRGGENVKVAVFMVMYRGPKRASFMWGS
jgi:hypothetical protein